MKTISLYGFNPYDETLLSLPEDSKILSIVNNAGVMNIAVLADFSLAGQQFRFISKRPCEDIEEGYEYVDQISDMLFLLVKKSR